MKDIYQSISLPVPEGVSVHIKKRVVTVTGPRGTIVKDLAHIVIDMMLEINKKGQQIVKLGIWHGNRKHVACLRTVKSAINNAITGVSLGFKYKMRMVYAHFPINVNITNNGKDVEIRNFLGEKISRFLTMLPGVTVEESKGTKDEIILTGNDINNVSQSAAAIKGVCLVRNKDIRKFLDGVYVSAKETVTVIEED